MRKIVISFLVLATILSSVSAFAQGRRGGSPDIRISIGDSNITQKRIQRLEAAVRDLQDIVYDLQDDRVRMVTQYVCALETSFDGTFIGKASTKVEAEAKARQACEQSRAMFCSSSQKCEKTEVQTRY